MDLKTEFETLSEVIKARKEHINNEEATKQSLIIPFIQKLGYDVFNPLEVQPEFKADFGFKKDEKVDYAIKKKGEIIIFIEAKPVYEEVNKHSGQLSRYFNATPSVRFAILTNGIVYKLFTDLNHDNIMDNKPFYTFNIEELTSTDMEVISHLLKENFNRDEMLRFSQELVYLANVNATLKDLFKNPTDDFVRFLIKDINNQRVTNAVIEKFRPIIKKAINKTLLEMIGEGLSVSSEENKPKTTKKPAKQTDVDQPKTHTKEIVTTEEELNGFEMVRQILKKSGRDIENIKYKDNRSYFTIMNGVSTKWFMRFFFDTENKNVLLRLPLHITRTMVQDKRVEQAPEAYGENVSRIYINGLEDLESLSHVICDSLDFALSETTLKHVR